MIVGSHGGVIALTNLLLFILFWGAVVAFIIWVIRRLTENTQKTPKPLDIARERYAKGEINKTDFDEIKKNL
jgi:putative membrane protein